MMRPAQESEAFAARRYRLWRSGALRWLITLPLLLAASAFAAERMPYVPAGPDVVLQRVPPTTDPRVRQFEQLRRDLAAHPGDIGRTVALAHAYIDYGRGTGDARFLGRAMALIAPHMQRPNPPISILLVHATIQQSRHFFEAARAELDQILKRDPGNGQAWLTLATVAMVQGDMDLANRACVQLANSSGNFMGLVCSASLRALTGEVPQAYALLSLVEDPGPKAPPDIHAWVEGLMADVAARMGNAQAADAHFRKALQFTPGDNFLLADYADFLLDHRRPADALALVKDDTDSDTSFLRRVYAEQALGLPQAAADARAMQARFDATDARGDHVFRREQAGFVLRIQHDPARALALAKENWIVQRVPNDVRVYLEAALAAHDPAAAQPVLAFIDRSHLSDVIIDPLAKQLRTAAGPSASATAATDR